jgi:hypothetical protein
MDTSDASHPVTRIDSPRRVARTLKPLIAARPALMLLVGTCASHAVVSTRVTANGVLNAGRKVNNTAGGSNLVWKGSGWLMSGVHSCAWGQCGGLEIRRCDRVPGTNSSLGDLSGSTAVFSHVDWINSVTAFPEPETHALMLTGLAGVVAAARRRQ